MIRGLSVNFQTHDTHKNKVYLITSSKFKTLNTSIYLQFIYSQYTVQMLIIYLLSKIYLAQTPRETIILSVSS